MGLFTGKFNPPPPPPQKSNEEKTDVILALLKVIDSSCSKDTKIAADEKIKELINKIN